MCVGGGKMYSSSYSVPTFKWGKGLDLADSEIDKIW